MKIDAFAEELKKINSDLTVLSSPTPGLAGIYWKGEYLLAIPDHNIYETPNDEYACDLPNGMRVRHRTRPEALAIIKQRIYQILNDPDYHDATTGEGKYSTAALKVEEEKESGIILP